MGNEDDDVLEGGTLEAAEAALDALEEGSEYIDEMLENLEEALKSDWREYRRQSFNANTKGAAYEKALAALLTEYLGEVFEIRTRTAIIDRELDCFQKLSPGQNEIDIVASFKQSKPHIVFESQDMTWVPYNGVAFVCEVKSELKTTSLREDLAKLNKLRELGVDPSDRFGVLISGDSTVQHQMMTLAYDKSSEVSEESLVDILENNLTTWDLVLLVEEDVLIANPNLPFSQQVGVEMEDGRKMNFNGTTIGDEDLMMYPSGFLWFLSYICTSIPHPPVVQTINPLIAMFEDKMNRERLQNSIETQKEAEQE